MRIALVTSEYVTEKTFDGGLANYMHRLALALKSMGHDPVVFVPYGGNDETFTHRGIEVHRTQTWHFFTWEKPWYRSDWKRPYSLLCMFDDRTKWKYHMFLNLLWRSHRLRRRIKGEHRRKPFDVIHCAHLGGVGFFRMRSVPYVTRLSSHTGLCQKFGGYGEKDSLIRQQEWVQQQTLKRSDRIFGPSATIAKMISDEVHRPISVIESPFLVDTEEMDESLYLERLVGKKYLLFFGTIGLIKGVGTIARMIHPLLERHKDLHFVFVGKVQDVPEGGTMMDHVKRSAKEHANRVHHFFALSHEQLYPIIQHAHAVVLPSRIDNFPNACIEAMYFGRIVVGTLGNGFEQMIDHKKSGYLVPVDDEKALLCAVEEILALSNAQRQAIGEKAHARIGELRPEKVVTQLLEFYRSAIDSKSLFRRVRAWLRRRAATASTSI